MAETPPETPPSSDDLTPDEERKFSKFLAKALADDDARQPAPPSTPPPSAPQGDISAQIKAALADHDKEKGQSDTLGNLVRDVEALKANRPKQRHWWFRPFSPMGGE